MLNVEKEKAYYGTFLNYTDTNGDYNFSLFRYDESKGQVYLSEIYVKKDKRRKGLGNKILNEAEKQAKLLGTNHILLLVLNDSWKHGWYNRCGYIDHVHDFEDMQFIWLKKDLL